MKKLLNALTAILLAAALLAGCIPSEYKKGIKPDKDFPDDILEIYKDATVFFSESDDAEIVVKAGTKDDVEDVIDFYMELFKDNEDISLTREDTDKKDEYFAEGFIPGKDLSFEITIEEARGKNEEKVFTTVFEIVAKITESTSIVINEAVEAGDTGVFAYSGKERDVPAMEIAVTEENPAAEAYGVTVDFGEYNIEGEATLAVRELPEKVDETNGVKVAAYDFTLGDKTSFDDIITIAIPYDEKYVDQGAEGECVGAKYYNESTGAWEGVVYQVDAENKQVIIYTTHLSLYGVFQVKNENTRKAYITDVYAVGSLVGGTKSYDVLEELAANGEPGDLAFEAGLLTAKTSVGGLDALTTTFTLGGQYDAGFAQNLDGIFKHAGLAVAAVQTCYDFMYNFSTDTEKLQTLGNLAQNIADVGVSYFGSAALQVGFASVFVFDYILTTVQSDMLELKLENIGEVYEYYNETEAPRTIREWRRMFIQIMQDNADDPDAAMQLISQEIDAFCGRFWELGYGKIKEIAGVSGKKYNFDERDYTNDREIITAKYKEYLMKRLQAPLTSARNYLLNQALESAQKEMEKQLSAMQAELNKSIKVKIIDEQIGNTSFKYTGYTVTFAPLNEKAAESKTWTGVMSDKGEMNTSFTVIGHLQSGMPGTIELYAPGEKEPEKTVSFKITYPEITISLKNEEKNMIITTTNVSGERWLMDVASEPGSYDDMDALYIDGFEFEPGESTHSKTKAEQLGGYGNFVETSDTTYEIDAIYVTVKYPTSDLELKCGWAEGPFTEHIVRIHGTYNEEVVIEWDGSEFRQVN